MKSEWKVTSNLIGDRIMYVASRVLNTNEVIHSGNMETFGNYTFDREEAVAIAAKLNEEVN